MRNPNCENCELHKSAKTVCLWGDGPKRARVMLVGEAPGRVEDDKGLPFQGESGQVLRAELARVGISPEEVYITNTVKCRPPDNKKPSAKQIKACKSYLDEEIATVKPEYIITLGGVPTKAILKKAKITEVHGQVIEMPNFKGMACFHPAYTLYDPSKLPVLKKDFERIANEINGIKVKKSKFGWRQLGDENLSEFFTALDNCEWFAFDTETEDLRWFIPGQHITCLNMSFDNGGGTWVLPLHMPFSPYLNKPKRRAFIIKMIAARLKRKKKKGVAHNGKYDNHWLHAEYGVTFPLDFDTMLASHLIDENRAHALDSLATQYLDAPYYDIPLHWKQGKFRPAERTEQNVRTVYRYGGKDAFYTLSLRPLMEAELKKDRPTYKLFYRLVMRASHAFHPVEQNGMFILMDRFKEVRTQVVRDRDIALKELNRMAGKLSIRGGVKKSINWNSPDQVAELLFKKLKLPVVKLTDGGKPSTAEATLVELKDKHPVATQLVKYRELEKFLNTYIDGWQELMHESRVYFSYKLHGTVTGRYSSRLHSTPRDGTIRNVVSAPDGWTFVQGDFSQAELRVAAILSGDLELRRCYLEGIDVHWRTLMNTIASGGSGEYVKPTMETASLYCLQEKLQPDWTSCQILQEVWESNKTGTESKTFLRICREEGTNSKPWNRFWRKSVGSKQSGMERGLFRDYSEKSKEKLLRSLQRYEKAFRSSQKWGSENKSKIEFNHALSLVSSISPSVAQNLWEGWKEARKKAKGINFGFLYSMRAPKFVEYAKLRYGFEPTLEEAESLRRAFFQLYRGLEPWHHKMKKLVKLDGSVRSLSGRLRRLPGIDSKDRALRAECERQAINSPVQGFIGDFKAMALVELVEKLDPNRARVVGEHHDAILFWVRTEHLKEELTKIARIMQNPALVKELKIELPVPIDVELEYGPWGQKGNTKWIPEAA